MKSKIQRITFYCKLITFNLCVVFFLCEIALHIFPTLLPESSQDSIMEFHPRLSVWYRPNLTTQYTGKCFQSTLHFNEMGLRSLPMAELLKKNEAWLFVGDSMIIGLQVDNAQLFTSLLQKQFNKIAIINIAKSGCGPIYYNKIIRNFLINEIIHPNVTKIFYFVYMGNDFDNLFEEEEDTKLKSVVKKYFYQIRTYHMLRIIYFQMKHQITVMNKSLFQKNNTKNVTSLTSSNSIGSPMNNEQHENLPFYAYPNQKIEQGRIILDTTLRNAKQIADTHGIELIVVPLPSVEQIQAGSQHSFYTYPISLIEGITEKYHIKFYNIALKMITYKEQHNLAYPYFSFECDGYFNNVGQEMLSNVMLEFIQTEKEELP